MNLSQLQQQLASLAVVKLLSGSMFSIYDFENLVSLLNRQAFLVRKDREALRCVNYITYSDMGPELARQVREKALEILGLHPRVIEVVTKRKDAKERATTGTLAKRLRLRKR